MMVVTEDAILRRHKTSLNIYGCNLSLLKPLSVTEHWRWVVRGPWETCSVEITPAHPIDASHQFYLEHETRMKPRYVVKFPPGKENPPNGPLLQQIFESKGIS